MGFDDSSATRMTEWCKVVGTQEPECLDVITAQVEIVIRSVGTPPDRHCVEFTLDTVVYFHVHLITYLIVVTVSLPVQ